jgi:hypothetical protein
MAELEKRQNALIENERLLAENDKLFQKEAYNLHAGICGESAESYIAKESYAEAFAFYHTALHYAILADQKNQLNRVIQLQNLLQLITAGPSINLSSLAIQIKTDMEGIRNTTSYRNCLSEVYEQTMQAFLQKMKSFGLVIPE